MLLYNFYKLLYTVNENDKNDVFNENLPNH